MKNDVGGKRGGLASVKRSKARLLRPARPKEIHPKLSPTAERLFSKCRTLGSLIKKPQSFTLLLQAQSNEFAENWGRKLKIGRECHRSHNLDWCEE